MTPGTVETRAAVLDAIREHCDRVQGQLLLALPASELGAVAESLAAVEDAIRVVMLYGTPADVRSATDYHVSDLATVARTWDVSPGFTMSVADQHAGLMAPNALTTGTSADDDGVVFGDPRLYHLANAWFMAHPWEKGVEWYVTDPPTLPVTYEDFRQATLQATLALGADRRVRVEATAKPTDTAGFRTVTGQLVATRQQFVYPKLSSVYGETTIVIRRDEGRATIGGVDAYLEDYEARSITLREMDDASEG